MGRPDRHGGEGRRESGGTDAPMGDAQIHMVSGVPPTYTHPTLSSDDSNLALPGLWPIQRYSLGPTSSSRHGEPPEQDRAYGPDLPRYPKHSYTSRQGLMTPSRYQGMTDIPETARETSDSSSRYGQRFYCPAKNCTASFTRKADVSRHTTSRHEVRLIDCDVRRCSRVGDNGFTRKDHLVEHKRGYHNQDIPKKRYWVRLGLV